MTTTTQNFSWRFGGWLSEQAPHPAWTILGLGAIGGIAFTFWSYRHALAQLEPSRRITLCVLRLAVWMTLLLILAAPTRVERTFEGSGIQRPLAVLVDRSGSMATPDNRKRRRLDDALVRWHEMEPAARSAFNTIKNFAFAEKMKPVASSDENVDFPVDQTNLFSSLQTLLAQAPAGGWGGIVMLTDGLDTSRQPATEEFETISRVALANNTPLFFVPGRNRYAGGTFFTIREFTAPSRTAPRSTFHLEATFDSYQVAARTIEVQLKVDGSMRPPVPLRMEAGRHLATWSADVSAQAPGAIELELRAADELARKTVRVELPSSNKILYFQGALDWGYRFLADILKRDAAFSLTPVFNFPNPQALLPAGALAKMPATSAELAGFDLVVLANAAAKQFSAEQQAVLSNWVHDGGILLFLTPDDDSTQGFAGSELEKMLPVVFLPPQPSDAHTMAVNALGRLRARTAMGGGSAEVPVLTAFAWEDSPHVREIFDEATKKEDKPTTPLFSGYAHVAHAKPGAEVLARHPTDVIAGGSEHAILLAVQRYGHGQSAVLTTDALWRWKLNQASTGRGVEVFWQNLFAWLGRDRQHGLQFDQAPLHVQIDRECVLRVVGADKEKLNVSAVLGNRHIGLTESAAEGDKRVFTWKPPAGGFWKITATDSSGKETNHWLTVDKLAASGEFSGMAPNEDLMQALAARTGGGLLEHEPPAAWQEKPTATELLVERRTPLWHREWVFGALLGLYGVELLLRRKWHLL